MGNFTALAGAAIARLRRATFGGAQLHKVSSTRRVVSSRLVADGSSQTSCLNEATMGLRQSTLTDVIVYALTAALCVVGARSMTWAAEPMVQSEAANGTPEIDGKVDDIWNSTPCLPVQIPVEAVMLVKPEEGATGVAHVLWDDKHLFVLIEVKDTVLSAKSPDAWHQDSVEIYVDEDASRSRTYKRDDIQYRVTFQGRVSGGRNYVAKNIDFATAKTDDGYRVEAALAFRTITPADGTKIGFELQINDDTGLGVRGSCMKWCDASDRSFHDTSGFGRITLKDRVAADAVKTSCAANEDKTQPAATSTSSSPGPRPAGGPELRQRVPDWATDAIFYQIFPERFRNGDRTNDPTRESLEELTSVPKSWRVSEWTGDWYARADWEQQHGDNFYTHGVYHRRYGGDLQGVVDQLDYLKDLGINVIYFNPVFYARSLHKYDGNSFHHIDPYFGPDPEGDLRIIQLETSDPDSWQWTAADRLFLTVVREAHARDIRVIIDGVFNHTGRDFFAFQDLREHQADSAYVEWYVVRHFDDPGTTENEFEYLSWWDHPTLPEFADNKDGTNLQDGPKQYIFDCTRRWMDPDGDGDPSDGIDGWRLDVANEVPPRFWSEWNHFVRAINPQAYTVAEIWTDAGEYLRRCGFSATMNYYGFAFPVKGFLLDGTLPASEFVIQLSARRNEHDPGVQFALQNLIDSHDTDRLASMIVNATGTYEKADRFDYDHGGSPRQNQRYNVAKPNQRHRAIQRLAALFQMTYVGAPMIYYGTESGMWGGDDPDDRKPMIWADLRYDDEANDPRQLARPRDAVAFDQELFNFYRSAIRLRVMLPALRRGSFDVLYTNDAAAILMFSRSFENQTVIVAINRGEQDYDQVVPGTLPGRAWRPVLATCGVSATLTASDDSWHLVVPSLCGAVFVLDRS